MLVLAAFSPKLSRLLCSMVVADDPKTTWINVERPFWYLAAQRDSADRRFRLSPRSLSKPGAAHLDQLWPQTELGAPGPPNWRIWQDLIVVSIPTGTQLTPHSVRLR